MKIATLKQLIADRAAKRAVVLATLLESGEQALYHPDEDTPLTLGGANLTDEARKALAADKSRPVDSPRGEVFLGVFNPPLRLHVIGAVHITQPLVDMATIAGFAVTVIDPRRAFATPERFPGITLDHDWPDEALTRLGIDARTAIVTLTHDPKIDDPALHVALRAPAFYIGALGSRRTHAGRVERLAEAGYSPEEIGRIHAPIGLAIGAKSPAEIAVAILAQIIEALRRAGERG
jgi:xanthine dehydrogenase accessory factor